MTEQSKHTPGPWRVYCDPCHYDTASDVKSDCGQFFASVGGKSGWQEQEANARLIAAAPDLLEALEAIVHTWDGPAYKHFMRDNIDLAKRAIAKAKGGVE